ncbi:MAG: hypothetical protein QHC67_15865, partial [Sphingobium sp.]|nr:hypothetical protein [Sphingobium sp.]
MTVTTSARPVEDPSRAKRLKALTSTVHEGVDRSIMSASSFASLERYKDFLAIQYLFHRDVAALYADKGSVAKIVKLEHAWRRLDGRNDDGF